MPTEPFGIIRLIRIPAVHGRCRIEHWGRARVASDAATQLAARTQLFFPR
jgi:hypothetical protein